MSTSLFARVRSFLSRYRTQITVPLVLLLLTVMSYCICAKPAANALLVPEWGTKYLLLPIALFAVVFSALKFYFVSLSAFIGYHAGLVLAVVGTDAGAAHFGYARITLLLTLAAIVILGIWAEVFTRLLPKWKAEHGAAKK